ncbi:MAG TPA: hypothetical protein VGP74_03110, partial [Rubrobacteraceae bacterium]|nr:hypothetical protein [Rubrobacteraceae bacterium]
MCTRADWSRCASMESAFDPPVDHHPGPRLCWCHSVIRFDSHEPNFFESDAQAVPEPHQFGVAGLEGGVDQCGDRPPQVVAGDECRRTCRSAASVSPCSPVDTMALMPMFVPSAKSNGQASLGRNGAELSQLREDVDYPPDLSDSAAG